MRLRIWYAYICTMDEETKSKKSSKKDKAEKHEKRKSRSVLSLLRSHSKKDLKSESAKSPRSRATGDDDEVQEKQRRDSSSSRESSEERSGRKKSKKTKSPRTRSSDINLDLNLKESSKKTKRSHSTNDEGLQSPKEPTAQDIPLVIDDVPEEPPKTRVPKKKERKAPAAPATAAMKARSTARTVVKVLDKVEGVGHLLVALFFAYLMGNWGFHWVFLLLLFVYMHNMELRVRRKFFRAEKRKIQKKQQALEGQRLDAETVEWLNFFVAKAWPAFSTFLARTLKEQLTSTFERVLKEHQPPAVESFIVSRVEFGPTPPQLKRVMHRDCSRWDPDLFRMDFDVFYDSEFLMEFKIKALKMNLPLVISNIELQGRMRLDMWFVDEAYLIRYVKAAFKTMPMIGMSIKPLKAIDIMDFPFIQEWLTDTIEMALRGIMVLPRYFELDIDGMLSKAKRAAQLIKQVPNEGLAKMKAEEEAEKQRKKAKSRFQIGETVEPELVLGIVKIRMKEAKDLIPTDKNGLSDPYFSLTRTIKGGKTQQWKSQQYPNTLHVIFDETREVPAEFMIMKDNPSCIIKLVGKDYDGRFGTSDSLGKATIDLTKDIESGKEFVDTRVVPLEGVAHGAVEMTISFIRF